MQISNVQNITCFKPYCFWILCLGYLNLLRASDFEFRVFILHYIVFFKKTVNCVSRSPEQNRHNALSTWIMQRGCFSNVKLLFSLLFILGLAGCGYHFIGEKSGVLTGIHSIAVPYFSNKSFEAGLERYLTEALVDEFVKSRMIAVVDEGDADAVIRGKIENFREFVISFDKNDRALEYRALAVLEVTLERRDTGEVLWRNKELFHFDDYRVSSEIAETESNKLQAIKSISAEIAERIHDSIIEGF